METSPGTVVGLMRAFELRHGDEPVELPLSAQRLLAFLALHGRPLLRPFVAGSLWTDAPEPRAGASLRSALWRLQRPGCRVVDASPSRLRLAEGVRVDFAAALAGARRVLDRAAPLDPRDARALREGGELLPDWYDDWVVLERERFRQVRLHALEALSERLAAEGRVGEALDVAIDAVAVEPLRESAHRGVIVLHLEEGNVGEAIRQLESYRGLLARDLGLRPSPELEHLVLGARRAAVAV